MRILAAVVTYNRLEYLKHCVESLIGSEGASFDLLVVDNASSDGSEQWLQEQQNQGILKMLRMQENSGGAGGFSAAIRLGIEQGYDRIWIMDDDTYVKPDSLAELVHADQLLDGRFGFLCSAVLWKDGTECRMNRVKLKKSYFTSLEKLKDGLILAEHATFVSMYFSREAILKVGLPIRQYFIWGDDIEYSMRLSHQYDCYLAGRSQVVHWMDKNVGSSIETDDYVKIHRYHYAFRNDGCTYRRYGLKGVCYYIGKCGIHLIRILTQAHDHRLQRIGTELGGIIASWFFHPAIEFAEIDEPRGEQE
jgi:GT2 family glycosyltransferase